MRSYFRPQLVALALFGLLAGCSHAPTGSATSGSVKATLSSVPSPPVVGHDNTFSVTVTDGAQKVTGAQVGLAFFFKGLNQTGPTATCTETAPGVYTAREISAGMAGAWEVEVMVSRPGHPPVKLTLPFRVAQGSGTAE